MSKLALSLALTCTALADKVPTGAFDQGPGDAPPDWVEGRRIQERLIRLFAIALQGSPRTSPCASGVGGFKAALHLRGLIPTLHMHRLNLPLNDAETRRIEHILAAERLLPHA
ncbi:hypothetical protein [Deinococcus sp. KSM4-11]|uniref:hypothetical protein n=1 Tax=Deinococcus sp. KSM4-11 TaxID=2568654 RepID=UPI00197AC574|nr:hypothetical protein [Deinococcus sp. KSM4-11]